MQLSSEFCLLARVSYYVLQQRVDGRIDSAEEKARYRHNPFQGLSLVRARFQAREIGFYHLAISRQAEEQGHIDADSFTDELLNCRNTLSGGRHFNQGIWAVQCSP